VSMKDNVQTDAPRKSSCDMQLDREQVTMRFVESFFAATNVTNQHTGALFSILRSMADPVMVFDKEQMTVLANPAAVEFAGFDLTGVSRSELRTRFRFFDRQGNEFGEHEDAIVIAMREKQTVEMEARVTAKHLPPNGFWVRAHAAPVLDAEGEVAGGVTVFQNINDRINLQTQRDALGSLITHDIKNQLAAESTYLDMMQTGKLGTFTEKQRKMLQQLKIGNDKFTSLSTTLLEIYRADVFAIEYSAIDVEALLGEIPDLNSKNANANGVSIVLEVPDNLPRIRGIATGWRQIIHNLVQNAITVSGSGQSVRITASLTPTSVLVEVSDNGPGMSPEEAAELFSSTAKNKRYTTNSTGFGLYLCGLLVQAQAGRISCSSKLAQGTTVSVHMPFAV
jgi:PAS domain S-box-containing protein